VAARLTVRLTPRGGRDAVEGWATDEAGRPYLKARVSAAPTEGEANAALLKLMAKALGVPKSKVTLAAGATARVKTLLIDGLDQDEAVRRLGGSAAAP
jgi:hypothetical protein